MNMDFWRNLYLDTGAIAMLIAAVAVPLALLAVFGLKAVAAIRARFQPTEGENGHE